MVITGPNFHRFFVQLSQRHCTMSFKLAIHGGAGVISRCDMSAETQAQYESALEASLKAGHAILAAGGTAVDAVEAAVRSMEDCPLFNAGKGAVFTHSGIVEMDASIMCGKSGQAGAVAAVHKLRNPITAARMVMEKSPHVLLIGDGAETFAVGQGAQAEDPSYFYTERRWQQLQTLLAEEAAADPAQSASSFIALDHSVKVQESPAEDFPVDNKAKFGTVGAVALDAHGNLAAATSTGGMSNKRWGRVGDSSIIGAGTYANNKTCAVSSTGHGEYFIRNVVAFRVSALMEYGGLNLKDAAEKVVLDILVKDGGEGGVISIDAHGNVSMPYNSEGMYRGEIDAAGAFRVSIFGDN